MENESPLHGSDQIALITSMIQKARNRYHENGFLYLLWGWVIFACCVIQFVAIEFFNFEDIYYIWMVSWLVLIYQVFYLRKKVRQASVRTYTEEIQGWVWTAFGVGFLIMLFILIRMETLIIIGPMILLLYGTPILLSGIIIRFKPLVAGGVICWLLSGISVFIPLKYHILLIALALITGWIIPGYLLKGKFKRGQTTQ